MNDATTCEPSRRAWLVRLGALGAIVVALAGATPWTARAADGSTTHRTLLVLGDSISAEYGLERDRGWVKLLDARLRAQHYDYDVVNASISGETTSGGRARIDELLERVKPAIVVVELGGNDALRGLALDASRSNLEGIVARAQGAHASVLLIGMQVPPNYGKPYGERFAAIYSSTAERYKTALTPFFFKGFADHLDQFQPDGIHPTAAAQQKLLDNVWPDLQPLLKRR
jgi:acyl-CoA thioesterase-1